MKEEQIIGSISDGTIELQRKIDIVRGYIDRYYLGEIDEARLIQYAVKGYVEGLGDRFTEFLTDEEHRELMQNVTGNFVGVGVYMSQDTNGNVVILFPIEGSPAEEIGIRPGDLIVRVDGVDVKGKELSLVSAKIMGEAGTEVVLEIDRDGNTLTKTAIRRQVSANSVRSRMLEGNVRIYSNSIF